MCGRLFFFFLPWYQKKYYVLVLYWNSGIMTTFLETSDTFYSSWQWCSVAAAVLFSGMSFGLCLWSILVRSRWTTALKTAVTVVIFEKCSSPVWSDDCGQVCFLRDLLRPSCFNLPCLLWSVQEETIIDCPCPTLPCVCCGFSTVITLNFSGDFNLCQDRSCTVKSRRLYSLRRKIKQKIGVWFIRVYVCVLYHISVPPLGVM